MNAAHYFRQAFRALRGRPALTVLCITVTSLGIGAATAVSSAVYALLLRPLPLPDADRLVTGFALREGFDPFATSILEFEAFRARTNTFADSGLARQQTSTLRSGGDTFRVQAAAVTADYLTTAAVTPFLGLSIAATDDRPGASPVAVVGHALWRRALGGREDAIGTTLMLDGQPTTVIGVMPPHFDLPAGAEVWVPMRLARDTLPLDQRLQGLYTFIARLRSGVSLDQANEDVRAIAAALADEHAARRGWTYRLVELRLQLIGDIDGRTTRAIGVLLVAVGLLLAICCVNVANLLLLRVVDRQRDMAVRLAIGASPRQVAAEQFVEYAVIGVAGGLGGALVAMWLAPLLATLNPIRADAFGSLLTDFRVDRNVLLLTLVLSAAATLVFALTPGLRARRQGDLSRTLMASTQRAGQNPAHARRLRVLVATQIAVAVVLLVGSGLVLRSFVALNALDLGFRPDGVVSMQLTLPAERYIDHRRRAATMDALVAAVRSLPGVTAAAVTTNIPLQRVSFDSFYTVDGRPQLSANDVPITAHRVVTADYLQLLGVRLIQGRLLSASDDADATRVVVITEELARQAWPGQDPIGRRVRRGRAGDSRPWLTVVGVVADVKEDRYNFRIDRGAWYLPYAQEDSGGSPNLVVRAAGDPMSLAAAIRSRLRSVDPDIGASELMALDRHVGEMLTTERFAAVLLAALAVAGVLLAAIGLYGAISHLTVSRRPEIALRMAVGAAPSRVIRLVVQEVAVVVVAGVAVGCALALSGGQALAAVLFGVTPHDAATFAVVALLIVCVSAAAAWVPAMRAAAIDPARVLR